MKDIAVLPSLIKKYDQPVPRYTSYPTVPNWHEVFDVGEWKSTFRKNFKQQNSLNGISLYIHLPFCESLCTYCGCNKKITTNHKVEEEYLLAIEREWDLYLEVMDSIPVIRELHLGGGTPTFFSPANLNYLLESILRKSIIHPEHEFSIEGHPNNTTIDHLQVLYNIGFRRVSFGVQDNDSRVQHIINRIQPFENVKTATENARKIGFTSVNFDLIYGLPLQTQDSIRTTINKVLELKPDRIAFYSYAHVPWTSKAQRLFDETDLPKAEEKINLYIEGKEILLANGYSDIGMDHFALPSDKLYNAWAKGKMYRNFMGYTTQNSGLLLGLGVSSISDAGEAFAQNKKNLHEYYDRINSGQLAIQKGYKLSELDIEFKRYILDISCRGKTKFNHKYLPILQHHIFSQLEKFEKDGLITWDTDGLSLTSQGSYFIRNICSAFDLYFQNHQKERLFSKAI